MFCAFFSTKPEDHELLSHNAHNAILHCNTAINVDEGIKLLQYTLKASWAVTYKNKKTRKFKRNRGEEQLS